MCNLFDNVFFRELNQCTRFDIEFHNKFVCCDIFRKFDGINRRGGFIVSFGWKLHKEWESVAFETVKVKEHGEYE